jgi:hypothetical protein
MHLGYIYDIYTRTLLLRAQPAQALTERKIAIMNHIEPSKGAVMCQDVHQVAAALIQTYMSVQF